MPTDPLAELASQLQAFIRTKHPFTSKLDLATLQLIELYTCLLSLSPALSSQERTT